MNNKLDHSYIAWISLLAYSMSVKLSPCPCSHSNCMHALAGRNQACLLKNVLIAKKQLHRLSRSLSGSILWTSDDVMYTAVTEMTY